MNKLFTIVSLILVSAFPTLSQVDESKQCGTYRQLEKSFEILPELKDAYYAHQLMMNSYSGTDISNNINKSNGTYTIPVVFHILHDYGTENITDA